MLDPFSGTGTTGQTALALGADYIGIELNADYIEIARRKLLEPPRWLAKRNGVKRSKPAEDPLPLFA